LIRNQQVAGSIPGGGLCLFCFCPSLHARPSGAYTRARRYRTSSLSATATGAPTVNERRTGSAAVSPALPNCCQTGPNYAAPPWWTPPCYFFEPPELSSGSLFLVHGGMELEGTTDLRVTGRARWIFPRRGRLPQAKRKHRRT